MTKEDILCNQILSAYEPKTVIDCATANEKMGNTEELRDLKMKKKKIKPLPLPESEENTDNPSLARMVYISKLRTNEEPTPLTYSEFLRLVMKDNKTFAIQAQINDLLLEHNGDKYACKDKYDELKSRQYSLLPHCSGYEGDGKRKKENLIHASGLAMLDLDGIDNPRQLFYQLKEGGHFSELQIALAYITPSNRGLRLIFKRLHGETIHDAQLRMAAQVGIEPDAKEFDTAVCDPARASVLVPRSLMLYAKKEHFYFADENEKQATWEHFDKIDRYGNNNIIATPASSENNIIATPASSENTNIAQPSSSENTNIERPTTYNYQGVEIPYLSIIDQLILGELKKTTPDKGQRHNTYIEVVKNLKIICDYDKKWMFDIIPSFDLPEEERRDILDYHSRRYNRQGLPSKLQQALAKAVVQNIQEDDNENNTLEPNQIPLPQLLPPIFDTILAPIPEPYKRQMIVWCLPFLGACGTGLRFIYRKQVSSLSFMTIIYGGTGVGKSSLVCKITKLLLKQIQDEDEERAKKQREYELQMDKYNRSRKANAERPQDPHCNYARRQSVRMSLTHIYKLLQNSMYRDGYDHKQDPEHIIGWTDEVDDLIQSENAGKWSEKKPLYKHAFHNEDDGTGTVTSGSICIPIFYNWAALGTFEKLQKFIDYSDHEGGLVNRIIFAQLPDDRGGNGVEIDDYTESQTDIILDACSRLSQAKGMYYCPVIDEKIAQWVKEKTQLFLETENVAVDILKNRSAAMGARAAYLVAFLTNALLTSPAKKYSKKMEKDMNIAADFGLFVAEYVFQNQMVLWGDDLNQTQKAKAVSVSAAQCASGFAALNFLSSLPHEFSKEYYIQQAALAGKSDVNIRKMLCDWQKKGRVVKTGTDENGIELFTKIK